MVPLSFKTRTPLGSELSLLDTAAGYICASTAHRTQLGLKLLSHTVNVLKPDLPPNTVLTKGYLYTTPVDSKA